MNGDRPVVNGEHTANGVEQSTSTPASHVGQLKPHSHQDPPAPPSDHGPSYANGDVSANKAPIGGQVDAMDQPPREILELIPRDNYLPIASLISRASQSCWNGLGDLVDQLAAMPVPEQPADQTKIMPNGLPNNQTRPNLEKKDRLLKFANDQKADFIKLLVILQWSKDVEEVSKTISINYWLMQRREAYWAAIAKMALLKQESSGFQIPNPDLQTAAEVLSRGRVADFPRLGYIPQKDLSNKKILRVLRSLNRALSVKLALSTDLPLPLQRFHIQDGRATFTVANEFELDVSILDESPESQYRMVDFRFSFQPCPSIPDTLHAEIERYANSNIDRDGLQGCYDFLHEMVLSYKLAEYHKQALQLSRNQYAGNLRVELIRRNLIVQYWPERQASRSWIEIGIASGRKRQDSLELNPIPLLDIRWMQQGKRQDDLRLVVDEATLSFEDILRQVIAQHSTGILDSIYEKLVLTPLFAEADLLLEQTPSDDSPEDCSLVMQLSQSSRLQLKVDSVTGLLVVSPVSERSERLQYEINRVQAVADEVVSKLLNFRCSITEAAVFAGIIGTSWEVLRSFKFNQAEIKALFGGPVVRLNFYRQPSWGLGHTLVITHGQNGDRWWLLRQHTVQEPPSSSPYHVLRSQPIEVKESLGPAYFARLAEYATGLISLQCNGDFLTGRKVPFDLAPFPAFERHYELPEISLGLDVARTAPSTDALALAPAPAASTSVQVPPNLRVCFGGVDRSTNLVTTIAKYEIRASAGVLRHVDKVVLATNVVLNAEDRAATIRVQGPISEATIPSIVDKAVDLERIVSTVVQVHRLPGLSLKYLSQSRFTITYHQQPPTELSLTIAFNSGSPVPQLEFSPVQTNPHHFLTNHYVKMFAKGPGSFAAKMRDFLTSLTLTLPLVTYLQKLQTAHGLDDAEVPSQPGVSKPDDLLRVHILVRSASAFAIQYFTHVGQAPSALKTETAPHLLARLEIMQHVNASKKPMWLVRPALEEFQAYVRPSYSAPALGAQLRQSIFSRADRKSKWLALDKAAACIADQPEPLLEAVHKLLLDWVKEAQGSGGTSQPETNKVKPEPTHTKAPPASGAIKKPAAPSKAPGKSQATANSAAPNGGVKGARGANPGGARPMAMANKANMNAGQNKEVITLD